MKGSVLERSMTVDPFESIDVRIEVLIGTLLILNTLPLGFGFAGPWEDAGFTRGIGGLIGCYLFYRAWFATTFGFHGMIPALHLWSDPSRSTSQLTLIGVATLGCGWVIGNPLAPLFAEPTGLIITLFGCLMLLVAGYAWLVFDGGLQDVDEEE